MAVFCDQDTPDYAQQDCGVERGGVVAMVAVDPTVGEPSNANLVSNSYWQTLVNASPPLAHIILKVRGDYPRATDSEEEGFGRESTQVTGADHVVNFETEGILDNRDFWESVNRKKWKFGFVSAGDILHFVNVPVTIVARPNDPRDIKLSEFWMGTAKWADMSNPRVVDVSNVASFQE